MTDTALTIEPVTIAGRPMWRDPVTGRCVPVVSGSDGPDDPPTPPAPPAPAPAPSGADLTALQALADKAAADAKAAAKAEFDAWLTAQKTLADEAALGEADRAKAEADRAKAEAETLRQQAAAELQAARIERALGAAGVPDTALADAAKLVTVDPGADAAAITAAVEALKTRLPALFATTVVPTPPGTTKPKPPAGGQPAKGGIDKGAERWRARHPQPAA